MTRLVLRESAYAIRVRPGLNLLESAFMEEHGGRGLIVNHELRDWDSVRSDLRGGSRVDAEIPHVQVQSILQDFRERVLPRRQRRAQRKPVDVRSHFPSLNRNF